MNLQKFSRPERKSHKLLLVDDDLTFSRVMSEAMRKRGFSVSVAHNVNDACNLAAHDEFDYAVVDLKMPGESGLSLIQNLHLRFPCMRIVMLTGYASIATAVEAIRRGASNYLSKPANADEVISAFNGEFDQHAVNASDTPLTLSRLEWEYLQRVLLEHNGNITAAARALNMHRRTLQRKLSRKICISENEVIRD